MPYILFTSSHDDYAYLRELPSPGEHPAESRTTGLKDLRTDFEHAAHTGEQEWDNAVYIANGVMSPCTFTSTGGDKFDDNDYADVMVSATIDRDGTQVEVLRFGYRIDGRS